MSWRALLVIALAGCGKLGFDALLEVSPAYPSAPAWNDWIRNDPTRAAWDQAAVPCDGNEPGFAGCLHAGELRRVATPFDSCSGLAIRDTLDAMQWTCVDTGGSVELIATGLQPGRGLRHLVDANGWRPDTLEVRSGGDVIATSLPAVWWPNPVVPAPTGPGSISLASAGAIYVIADTLVTRGYSLDADHIGLVVSPGATLVSDTTLDTNCNEATGDGSTVTCMIVAGPQHFLWIEGDLDARDTANYGVLMVGTTYSRVRGTRVTSASVDGLSFLDAASVMLSDAVAVDAALYGVAIVGGENNVVVGLTAANDGRNGNPGATGVFLGSTSGNVLTRVLAANDLPYGVLGYTGATNNTLAHLTLASNAYDGLHFSDPGNVVAQVVAVNQPNAAGLHFGTMSRGAQLVAANNNVGIQTDTIPPGLSGVLLVGANGQDCVIFQAGGYVDTCAPVATSAAVMPGIDLTTALRAAVTTDDAQNASDVAGAAPRSAITDWFHFESPSRTWGEDGPWPGTADVCVDNCRIWDWRRAPGDTTLVARDRDGAPSDEPVVPGAACPARLDGDNAAMDASGRYFLLEAVELIGDGRGDDDGLCQSGEVCVDLRTAGAHRDELTAWIASGCTFHDGVVTGVDMRGTP